MQRNRRTKRGLPGRRRPGENWNLWRVVGRDRSTKRPRPVAYLVTDRSRWPNPVAMVPRVSRGALKLALAIRQDPQKAFAAIDLRTATRRRFYKPLIGMVLLPVDSLGRRIGNSRTFAGGMYSRSKVTDRAGKVVSDKLAFYLFARGCLPSEQEEGGTPVALPIPQRASKMNGKARDLTAAVA